MYDALTASVKRFNVVRDPEREPVRELGVYDLACAVPGGDGAVVDSAGTELIDMLQRGDAVSIDVREPHEKVLSDIAVPGVNLPMCELEVPGRVDAVLDGLPTGDVVVYCAGGVRSAKFVEEFGAVAADRGLTLHSLPGGAQRWVANHI